MPNARWPKGGRWSLFLGLGLVVGVVPTVRAQAPRPPHRIRWYEVAVAAAGVSAFFLLDNSVRNYMVDHQSAGKDDVSDILRRGGQPEVWALVPATMMGTGLLFKKPGLRRAGLRAVTSVVLAEGATEALKRSTGRLRPNVPGADVLDFQPFSGNQSLASGHTSAAFGLAASLADEVRPLWAKVGLYTLATGTAWSRVYDNKHWTSDVVAGALIGIASAKLVNGSWRVWGIHPPGVFTDGRRVTLGWRGTF